jgi:predicted nuclease with RNAse H fold
MTAARLVEITQPAKRPRETTCAIIGVVTCWLGIDVGGQRKGFDAAVVNEGRLLSLAGRLDKHDVVRLVRDRAPTLIAIDSPRCWAPEGKTARAGELELNRRVCGIRWTPDQASGATGDYYAWIRGGLTLYEALGPLGIPLAEVFPTASWTRWSGPRGPATRARWSREALASLGLEGIPKRTNQDQRDAIAAAVTARAHTAKRTETFGEIIVPLTGARSLALDTSEGVPSRRAPRVLNDPGGSRNRPLTPGIAFAS